MNQTALTVMHMDLIQTQIQKLAASRVPEMTTPRRKVREAKNRRR
jgi:hypothetical protein